MERRRTPRMQTRIHAEVWIDGSPEEGRVLDVSEGGLSVETRSAVPRGESVRVVLEPTGQEAFEISAIAWHCRAGETPSGGSRHTLGLMIASAPEAYRALLPEATDADDDKPETDGSGEVAGSGTLHSFRVRVGNGARTRTLTISATSDAEARTLVAESLEGWDLLDLRAR